jgi:hypothetical protein
VVIRGVRVEVKGVEAWDGVPYAWVCGIVADGLSIGTNLLVC